MNPLIDKLKAWHWHGYNRNQLLGFKSKCNVRFLAMFPHKYKLKDLYIFANDLTFEIGKVLVTSM